MISVLFLCPQANELNYYQYLRFHLEERRNLLSVLLHLFCFSHFRGLANGGRVYAMSTIKNVLAICVIIFALCNLYFVYIVFNTIAAEKKGFELRELSERRDLSFEHFKLAIKGTFLVFSVFCSVFLVVGATRLNRFSLTLGFIILLCQILVVFYNTISFYYEAYECQRLVCPLGLVLYSALFVGESLTQESFYSYINDALCFSFHDRHCF